MHERVLMPPSPVAASDQHVLDPAALELDDLLEPDAEHLAGALHVDAQRDVRRFVLNHALIAAPYHQGVELDDRVDSVQGPLLAIA